RVREPLSDAGEHGRFFAELADEELLAVERAAIEEREADEERDGSGARAEARRLGVEVERAFGSARRDRRVEREQREELARRRLRLRDRRAPDAMRARERERPHMQRSLRGLLDA